MDVSATTDAPAAADRGQQLADEFAATRDPVRRAQVREALVENELLFVRSVVFHLPNPLPQLVTVDDLVQCGMLGLMAALERYRPGSGARFRSWAYPRIRGAALDAIRRLVLSRSQTATCEPIDGVDPQALPYAEIIEEALPAVSSLRLQEVVAALPPRQATILLLLANGLRPGFIANALALAAGTVQKERMRALHTLRLALLDDLGADERRRNQLDSDERRRHDS